MLVALENGQEIGRLSFPDVFDDLNRSIQTFKTAKKPVKRLNSAFKELSLLFDSLNSQTQLFAAFDEH